MADVTFWSKLTLPEVEEVRFKKNLIQKTVCELRFPTLYGLDPNKPPMVLANALRKSYPDHSIANDVNMGPSGIAQDAAYIFSDKKSRTSVSLRPSALTVETSKYTSFEDFHSRIMDVAKAAKQVIDTEFYTRVGLRYINMVPYDRQGLSKWVNPSLVDPLAAGPFGELHSYWNKYVGQDETAGFLFAHGIGLDSSTQERRYILDYDFFQNDVELDKLDTTLEVLHRQEFRMFSWSLGPAAFESMGAATPKVKKDK